MTDVLKALSENTRTLKQSNIGFKDLLNGINEIKDKDDRERLMDIFKRSYAPFQEHVETSEKVIKTVGDFINAGK